MKQIPIKFRSEYDNSSSEYQDGFTPFRDGLGRHIRRIVELEPVITRHGACVIFRIIDVIVDNGSNGYSLFEKKITTWEIQSYHTYEHSSKKVEMESMGYLLPNFDQAEKIVGLARGEITGEYAEKISNQLLFELLIEKDEQSKFSSFLPEVVEWYHNVIKPRPIVEEESN